MRRAAMRGVTLLEILIAMMLLALLAGGVFSAFVFSKRTEVNGSLRTQAARFAQATAEDLRLAMRRSADLQDELTNPNNSALTLKQLIAGETKPGQQRHHPLKNDAGADWATNPLNRPNTDRWYTVHTGKYSRDGTKILWDADVPGGKDEDGKVIDDHNFDIKKVEITVHYDDVPAQ